MITGRSAFQYACQERGIKAPRFAPLGFALVACEILDMEAMLVVSRESVPWEIFLCLNLDALPSAE